MYQIEVFAQRLRELRKREKESQEEVAGLIGVKPNQVSEMERAKKTTSFERLTILCEHYNISADYLLGLSDTPRKLK